MRLRLYKATERLISLMTRVLSVDVRADGIEALPDRPVLFVANHFTRSETFLLPYAIYRRFGLPARSLATHAVFKGLLGRYLEAVGVLSTRAPNRNRTIIGELMTGRANWIIYPEGGLIKNKKMVENGRLRLSRAERQAPPHTGAAMMALKAELRKRRYRDACAANDTARMALYESRYALSGPDDLSRGGVIVVPVTITYPRMRATPNLVFRTARRLARKLHPYLAEELQVEGTILFGGAGVSLHFGAPIEVDEYLDRTTELARRLVGVFRHERSPEPFLRRQARRLTSVSMRRVYTGMEVNLEHLFCYGLRAAQQEHVSVRAFRQALYLATMELRALEDVRLHPTLTNGINALMADAPYGPLSDIEALAAAEGVLGRENGSYLINRDALREPHEFHSIRLRKMVQVIANELEPLEDAVALIESVVNLSENELGERLARAVHRADVARYRREYERWQTAGVSKPPELGEPFLLERKDAQTGIVLVHGYLSCPEQMRPFAEALHADGCTVYGVRLDGHGTAPAQLTDVRWRGWMENLAQAHMVVSRLSPRVIVGGFSLGGVLAALLAARGGGAIDGLFTINAPLKLRNRWAHLTRAALHVNRLLEPVRGDSDFTRRLNYSESPDLNYEEDYLHGVHELRLAIRACRRNLGRVTAPALVIQTDDDPVVAPQSADRFVAGLGSARIFPVRIPGDRHLIVRGDESAAVLERVRRFVDLALDGVTGSRTEGG